MNRLWGGLWCGVYSWLCFFVMNYANLQIDANLLIANKNEA